MAGVFATLCCRGGAAEEIRSAVGGSSYDGAGSDGGHTASNYSAYSRTTISYNGSAATMSDEKPEPGMFDWFFNIFKSEEDIKREQENFRHKGHHHKGRHSTHYDEDKGVWDTVLGWFGLGGSDPEGSKAVSNIGSASPGPSYVSSVTGTVSEGHSGSSYTAGSDYSGYYSYYDSYYDDYYGSYYDSYGGSSRSGSMRSGATRSSRSSRRSRSTRRSGAGVRSRSADPYRGRNATADGRSRAGAVTGKRPMIAEKKSSGCFGMCGSNSDDEAPPPYHHATSRYQ